MVRRRTAAVSFAAAALLLASPALTACSSGPDHTGAAAVVGDHRITIASLQSRVDDLRSSAAASPATAQSLDGATQLPSHVLTSLVQAQVVDKALDDKGLSVSAAEVEQERQSALQQFGGSERQFEDAMLTQRGIAPNQLDSLFRTVIAESKITSALGYQPGSDGGTKALNDYLIKTATSLHVQVNPRYGTWDAKTGSIGAAREPWVVTKTQLPTQGGSPDTGTTGVA
ncbi:SurA N-terminal domain-containing protein [Actinacidiphila guanduensis]|uniref:SurA N-terminal domain-containing protein n=1 Tax=Actinacidiphila guanduensis TaxID=310781 RepID=A0A1H0EXW1_9ACTN|nr:SurA N-terminal domain-containing protein [Actinacidiphila guanduensis]SDN87136.1 SurA N-terminal domain-containing protein [Actinacidiphila guanduensis]